MKPVRLFLIGILCLELIATTFVYNRDGSIISGIIAMLSTFVLWIILEYKYGAK
jgi:hypothetical protein